MTLTVLQASEKFTKTIIHREDGEIEKLPYPMLRNVTSADIRIESFQDLENTIRSASKYGQAVLRGNLTKSLSDESRAGHTDYDKPTRFFVLDVDALRASPESQNTRKEASNHISTVNGILQNLSLLHSGPGSKQETCSTPSLLLQYSASNNPKSLSCHIFGWLEESVSWDVITGWMKHKNLTVLKDQLRLNRIGTALSWPLDISVCNPSKLIYVAPPRILTPEGEQEPEEHIFVLRGNQDFIPVSLFNNVPSEVQIKALETRTKNSLVRNAKLPEIPKTTHQGNIDILYNPPRAKVTGEKCERGFVYLNLNGGDSWGYYYPENDPTILYNFKGEPCYILKELCPEYYNSLSKEQTEINIPGVFRDGDIITVACALVDEQQYGYITYDASTKIFTDILKFNSKTMFLDHCKSDGHMDFRKNISSFRSTTDFTSDSGIDFKYRRINWYEPSDILSKSFNKRLVTSPSKDNDALPINVKSLLMHLCRYDEETYEHLLDWLAAVLQLREPLRTAWIFTGVQGTGKNILYELMKTTIGYKYCMNPTLGQFDDQFITGALENKLFVMVDEADQDACRNAPDILSKLKQLITCI
jgi:hypothetical protein